jgi:hypothetical protein
MGISMEFSGVSIRRVRRCRENGRETTTGDSPGVGSAAGGDYYVKQQAGNTSLIQMIACGR